MPWAVVLRMIARLAAVLFTWRLVTARRGAAAGGARRPIDRAKPPLGLHPRGGMASVREGASLVWRATAMVALVAVAALVITGGVTTVVLGPRWLGGALLGLALLVLAAAVAEGVALVRILTVRRKRRHDNQLRREV